MQQSDFKIDFSDTTNESPDIGRELDFLYVRHSMVLPASALETLQAHCEATAPLNSDALSDQLLVEIRSHSAADGERRANLVKSMVAYVLARRAVSESRTDAAWSHFANARFWEGKVEGDYEAWIAIEQKRKGANASQRSKRAKLTRLKSEVLRSLARLAPKRGWTSKGQAIKAIWPTLKDFVDRENAPWLTQHLDDHLHVWLDEDMEVVAAFNAASKGYD